jgi:hypothetical protein
MSSASSASPWSRAGYFAVFLAGVAFAVPFTSGCGDEGSGGGVSYAYGGAGSASGSGSGGSSSGGSTKPMLVLVDTDRTMNANPGDGVGVFTEYRTGGHWRVWWTCDTNKTSQSCSFDVVASVAGGSLDNVAGMSLATSDQLAQGGAQVEAQTTTTTSVQGMTFDAPAGATITLDAQMDGQRDGSFLFFVQDGKINGGYSGMLTDPLMLQPSAP